MEVQRADVGTMRRRMPWISVLLAPHEQLGLLPGRKLAPAVFGRGHDGSLPEPQDGGKTCSGYRPFGVPPSGG